MNIAISNIAWNTNEDKDIVSIFKKYHIPGVEIAPTKIWSNPIQVPSEEIRKYRQFWNNEGVSIVAIQSVLFGHPELTIFSSKENREQTLLYIIEMIRVTSLLGAKVVVFGSPKNRYIEGISMTEAAEIAQEFFLKIGLIAQQYDIYFCIEPNPKEYGANFITNADEAIKLVKRVNHPNFQLHLDLGVMTINNEDYVQAITNGLPYLKHFHISEKNLLPIDESSTNHTKVASFLAEQHYPEYVSVEMRGDNMNQNYSTVEKTLSFVSSVYG